MKFTADWCGYCRKMERTTFSDPVTIEVVHREFVPLLINTDKQPGIAKQLGIRGLPAVLIVAPDMTVLERITGYQATAKLLPKLNAVTVARRSTPRVPALPTARQRTTTSGTPNQNPFADNPFETQRPRVPTQPSFNGLCLVSVVEERELIAGSAAFAAEYRGQLLHFRNASQHDLFFQNPDRYWPMLDGICTMTFLETGKQVPGQLRHAAVFRERIWVFQTREQLTLFLQSPGDHAARVEERQKQSKTASRSY